MPGAFQVPANLTTVRNKRGVSLREISVATRIGVNYLEAIESGEFEKLPGGIYSTSYIRQYARAIDFDEEELLEYYYRAMGIDRNQPEITPARRNSALPWFARVLG